MIRRMMLAVTLMTASCFDFGYEIAPPMVDAGSLDGSGGGDTGGGAAAAGGSSNCTEGETTPSSDGPQVRFVALNVDVATVKIKAGDVVTWTNGDTMPHSVIAGAPGAELSVTKGGFSSPEVAPDGRWAYRFCNKRSLFYFCGKHPSQMFGYRVVVE